MSKSIVFLLIFLLNKFQIKSQKVQCPYVVSKPSFILSKFTGMWYQIASTPTPKLKLNRCVVLNVIIDSARLVRISINYFDGKETQQINNAFTIKNSSGIYNSDVPFLSTGFEFIVIDTDNTNFAIVYSCSRLLNLKLEMVWIMSRKTDLDPNIYKSAIDNLKQQKLPYKNLKAINQTNKCPKYF